jgi:multimeric flavodoxin WrbA
MLKKVLIIDGSLGGASGNSQQLIQVVNQELKKYQVQTDLIHLKENPELKLDWMKEKISWAQAYIFISGTYWDSWSSLLQKFLEVATEFEGTDIFLGKPAGVFITMHSVGGKEVLSRLQGVLNTMGLAIPPMSGMVYSLATHIALKDENTDFAADFWSMEDCEIIVHNLITYLDGKRTYRAWPVDRKDPTRKWLCPT